MRPTETHTERWLHAKGGIDLFSHSWIPEEYGDHLCVILGLSEHSGRYGNLVQYFLKRGFAVHLLDHRGFGRSQGQRGHVEGYPQYLDDLRLFTKDVRERFPSGRLMIIGHSLGGLIALAYSIRYPGGPDGLILSAPALKARRSLGLLKGLAGFLDRINPRMTLRHRYMHRYLSHDPSVGKAYIRDPLVHPYVTPRFCLEYLKMSSAVHAQPEKIPCPSLFLCPLEDRIVDPQATLHFFRSLNPAQHTLKTYPSLYHELFSEIGKEIVFSDMDTWLQSLPHKAPS